MNHSSRKCCSHTRIIIALLLACCAVPILSSCAKKASDAIIGKWRVQSTKETVEFRKDGTVINLQNQKQQNGKYTFTDDSHMNLQINTGNTNMPEVSASCEVHIHGDKMDMTVTVSGQGQQQKTHFTRLK